MRPLFLFLMVPLTGCAVPVPPGLQPICGGCSEYVIGAGEVAPLPTIPQGQPSETPAVLVPVGGGLLYEWR